MEKGRYHKKLPADEQVRDIEKSGAGGVILSSRRFRSMLNAHPPAPGSSSQSQERLPI